MAELAAADPIEVTDPLDPRLAMFGGIRDRDYAAGGLFVCEGRLVVGRLLEIPELVAAVLAEPAAAEWAAGRVEGSVPVYAAPRDLLAEVVGYAFHRGILALGRRRPLESPQVEELVAIAAGRPLVCVEGITNADNLGLVFRTARALGAAGVVLSADCHDPLYRRSVRVSMGHVFRLAWSRAHDFSAALAEIRSLGYRIVGTTADRGALALGQLPHGGQTAIVVGGEAAGLSPAARGACDTLVRVPMAEGVDSLNVAVALGICLHHVCEVGSP